MLGSREVMTSHDTLSSLEMTFRERGYLTHIAAPSSGVLAQDVRATLIEYDQAVRGADMTHGHVILLGLGERAQFIAKYFWDFYSQKPPRAAILLGANIPPIQLNQITCPYLILNGEHDRTFAYDPYERTVSAVHHHQMRYGDVTTNFRFPGVEADLTVNGKLSPEVLLQITEWLKTADAEGMRPQEAA